MSVDHDRQSANYCQQCSAECSGIDEVTIDEDFLLQGQIEADDACIVAEGSRLKIFTHAEGDE